MATAKNKPALFEGPRTPGPHGKTLELAKITRPEPEYVVEFRTKELKIGKLTRLVRDGVWNPHRNPDRDSKRNAKLRRDEPLGHVPVERTPRKRSTATGGRQVLIPRTRKAAPHPFKMERPS